MTPAPVQPSVIVAPPETGGGGMGRKLLWGIVGLLAIGLIVIGAMSFFGGKAPVATPTLSPSPTLMVSASPAVRTLTSYFGSFTSSVSLPDDSTAFQVLSNAIRDAAPVGGRVTVIGVSSATQPSFTAGDLLDRSGTLPAGLRSVLAGDWKLASYGQAEVFDDAGVIITDPPIVQRMILAAEVADASAVNQLMTSWESSGLASADQLFSVPGNRRSLSVFSSGTYKTIPIRYMNFPYADTSIDYALVLASNGKSYLVFSTSRASMYWAIDTMTK